MIDIDHVTHKVLVNVLTSKPSRLDPNNFPRMVSVLWSSRV